MTTAWIEGRPVSTGEAIREAVTLLSECRLPLVTGALDDMSALREAARLAGLARGVLDHQGLAPAVPLIEALRDNGIIRIAPAELRRRADRVLVIGRDAFAAEPALFEQIFSVDPDLGAGAKGGLREIVLLGPDGPGRFAAARGSVRTVPCGIGDLGDAVGILRAALAGRPFGNGPFEEGAARALAGWLQHAGFAAIVFDAGELDAIAIEMVAGLVSDLNAGTRASALPLLSGGALGAAEGALWTTGFPLRTAFGRGGPAHDMVLNDGARLVSAGEADCRVLVTHGEAAGGDQAPDRSGVPTILLSSAETPNGAGARIAFHVGRPGIDHASVVHEPRFGSFVTRQAEHSGMAVNAADILSAIADLLGERSSSNDEARA
ncbi:hypothetical protein U0C82_02890 [Fulvimarina sp. 2208YS6-2-32]|uniref:Tungsten formylmethanofuran dehydrogenase n=1 Tax=Fulvimarina uroteuthidis TaxID=3098149 RepID=A0ABU5HYG5_9HYPH|nr:hypothetical protein [Fulvimarina sp. 2208YS6-2-32]MDY8108095.1 hypothetical protein [Fulvimarina sp. 2208YS6-2-32]